MLTSISKTMRAGHRCMPQRPAGELRNNYRLIPQFDLFNHISLVPHCRFLSIAQYLIENKADLAAVNSDGDLAIDLADSERMRHLLEKHMIEQNIDCDEARQSEEKLMLHDAENWLRSDASEADRPHPRTGATAMHVAAAKGYIKVLSLLLATRADVDKQDNDGWTPLHAAARWGQKEAAQMLVASLADMDVKNYAVCHAIAHALRSVNHTNDLFYCRVKRPSM